jgi:hypothetical protein
MNKIHPVKRTLILGLLLLAAIACALPIPAKSTPTPTANAVLVPALPPVNSSGGAQGGSAGGSSADSGNNASGPAKAVAQNPPSEPATDTPQPPPDLHGPYDVKQLESLGHETISGMVCSVANPFFVTVTTPRNVFMFDFIPNDASHGRITYAYNLPSAGESHSAAGTYQLSKPEHDGTLHLTMRVSDHVVFKGFDGNIPNSYKFDLVPSSATCP